MAELLLELYSEEIPPELQIGARAQIKKFIENSFKDNEYSELINRKTFSKIIEIYYANLENIQLEFNFNGTGNANILKLKDKKLNEAKKIHNRLFGLRNIIRNILLIKRKPKM